MEEKLSQLETEYDLQGKIMAAYQKLTRDTNVSKSIRRSREQCYHKAHNKVRNHQNFFIEQLESLWIAANLEIEATSEIRAGSDIQAGVQTFCTNRSWA